MIADDTDLRPQQGEYLEESSFQGGGFRSNLWQAFGISLKCPADECNFVAMIDEATHQFSLVKATVHRFMFKYMVNIGKPMDPMVTFEKKNVSINLKMVFVFVFAAHTGLVD